MDKKHKEETEEGIDKTEKGAVMCLIRNDKNDKKFIKNEEGKEKKNEKRFCTNSAFLELR